MKFSRDDSVTSIVNKFKQLYSNLSERAIGTVKGIVICNSKVILEMINSEVKGVNRNLTDAEELIYSECI